MKSNVLKTVLPMAVIAFALASAAGTSSLNKDSNSAVKMGYQRINNPFQCLAIQECDEGDEEACTAPDGVTQLYSPVTTCNVPLTRNHPN